ncbi:MAG: O-antigen ligase family protein [Planctomycetes bacterium]|nr:O-antigen ligase family protein [Planctomycetota bacterium]
MRSDRAPGDSPALPRVLVALLVLVPLAEIPGAFTDSFRAKNLVLVGGAALLALLAAMRLRRPEVVTLRVSRHVIAGAALFLLFFASLAWAGNRFEALQTALARAPLGVVFLAAYWSADRFPLRLLLLATAIGGIGVAFYGLFQAMGWDPLAGNAPAAPVSTLGNANFAAAYLSVALPALLVLSLTAEGAIGRSGWLVATALVASHLVLLDSRGGWAAAIGGALVAAGGVALGRRDRRAWIVAGALALAALALVFARWERARSVFDPGHPTNRVRVLIWGSTARLAADHPALGVGAGNFRIAFGPYRDSEEALLHPAGARVEDPHDLFLVVLAEAGPAGLAALALVLGGAALGIRRGPRVPEDWALAGTVVAFLFHGLVLDVLDVPPAALSFFFACGLLAARSGAPSREVRLSGVPARAAMLVLALVAACGAWSYGTASLADHELVAGDANEAARLAPQNYRAHHERGRALSARGRFAGAAGAFEAALALHPTYEQAWDGLALARWGTAGTDEEARRDALDAWDRAVELAPWDPSMRTNRGKALKALGRFEEAADDFAEAFHAGSGTNPGLALFAAQVYALAGNRSLVYFWLWNAVHAGLADPRVLDQPGFAPFRDSEVFRELREAIRMARPQDPIEGDRR